MVKVQLFRAQVELGIRTSEFEILRINGLRGWTCSYLTFGAQICRWKSDMLTCIAFVFQLRSRERTFYAFDDRQISCKELGLQIGLEAIKLSLKDLDQLKRTVNEKLLTLDREILEIHREIDKSGQESKRLRRDINREFTVTENSIAPDWRMRFKRLHSPVLQRRNLAYLRELDEKSFEQECKTIDDALDKLKETSGELGVITNDGFEVAFKRLTEIKEDSALHTQDLSDIRSIVESRFIKIRELIQSNQKQLLERI